MSGCPTRGAARFGAARLITLALAAALVGAGPAAAHGTESYTPARSSAKAVEGASSAKTSSAAQTRDPGEEHAAEHAEVDAAIKRFDKLPAARKRAIRKRLLAKATPSNKARRAAAGDPPEVVGKWTSAPFDAPDYAIHAVMLTGGRVLLFSMGSGHGVGPGAQGNTGQGLINDGQATIWDPALGEGLSAFKEVDPPPIPLDDPFNRPESNVPRPAPLFCAGQVQLADGRILIAGGNLEAASPGYGLKILFLFDPQSEQWVREPDMIRNRWYPTLTRMPDGRVAILGGQDEAGRSVASFELYPNEATPVAGLTQGAPLTGIQTSEPAPRRDNGMYPHTMVLPSGRLASSSWGAGPMALWEPTTGRWITRNQQQLAINGSYPTAFPRPGDQNGTTELIQAGGNVSNWWGPSLSNQVFAIKPEQEKTWRQQPALNVARRNSTAVLLPDGTAVNVGGGGVDLRFSGNQPANLPQKQIELWDPATGKWNLGPAQEIPRGYHSIALLLADGRVLSAGDDYISSLLDTNRADNLDSKFEIYSPPYLFKGNRPQIDAAPAAAGYGESMEIRAFGDRPITRATLVAPGSPTHAIDMNQRVLELPITGAGSDLYSITGPTTSAAAPPGDYMLFVLNDLGVPSVASWVRIRPDYPGQGTPVLTPLLPEEPTPGPGTGGGGGGGGVVTPDPGAGAGGGTPQTPSTTPDRAAVEGQLKTFFKTSSAAALAGMKRIARLCPEPKKAAVTTKGKAARERRMEVCRAKAVQSTPK